MNYTIHITAAAERDLANAADHMEFVLKNPQAADDLLEEAEARIHSFASFPARFPLANDRLLASWGIRFIQIKNHLAFYIISQEEHQVFLVRFLYRKSDWISILRQGFSLI